MSNIVEMPTPMNVLADRIKLAYGRTVCGREGWIEGTLELAAALGEARSRFPSNIDFGVWLVQNELDWLGKDDRAALLGMSEDPALTRVALEETKSTSWRLIWLEWIELRLRNAAKMDVPSSDNRDPAQLAEERSEPAETRASKRATIRPSSPFYGRPRADEVYSAFLDKDARSVVGKAIAGRGGADIYEMILKSLDLGFLRPNRDFLGRPNLRMLFSLGSRAFCQRFDLTNTKERVHVRENIFPAMLANREAILASPDDLEKILDDHKRRNAEQARKTHDDKRFTQAKEKMGPGEEEIIMYGQRFWPVIDNRMGVYDYPTLCLAIWHFQDQLRLVSMSSGGRKHRIPGHHAAPRNQVALSTGEPGRA